MDYADGDAVITMDSDMQHPPGLIPELLKSWSEGFDIVQTVRRSTDRSGWFKNATSRGFYTLVNEFSHADRGPTPRLPAPVPAVVKAPPRPAEGTAARGLVSWVGFGSPASSSGSAGLMGGQVLALGYPGPRGLISFSSALRMAVVSGLAISAVTCSTASSPPGCSSAVARSGLGVHHPGQHVPRRREPSLSRDPRHLRRLDRGRDQGTPDLHRGRRARRA
jgi:hypothetical protein